ncbi:hypothetical protein FIBSPDRAFT_864155, partial [Athelia psychrophila]
MPALPAVLPDFISPPPPGSVPFHALATLPQDPPPPCSMDVGRSHTPTLITSNTSPVLSRFLNSP